MGKDNLFHKRKAKMAREVERKNAKRAPYDKVLIVTEGSKTEPVYFRDIKNHYKINSANIEIDGSSGSSPLSVVEHAYDLYHQENKTGNPYDRVYCVFDKDAHASYQAALDRIKNIKKRTQPRAFHAINSVPCFEYWLLLHYRYTTSPLKLSGSTSAADAVIKDLKKHIPNYDKSMSGVFAKLLDKLEDAKKNAADSLIEAKKNNTDNPSTRVHEIVTFLQNIKR